MSAKKIATKKTAAKTGAKTAKAKKVAVKQTAAKKEVKKIGLLEAAFRVLLQASEPLTINAIMSQISQKRMWRPSQGGLTPGRSLSAAIGRSLKLPNSKFKKTGRGLFTAVK